MSERDTTGEEERLEEIVSRGPSGAFAVAGVATENTFITEPASNESVTGLLRAPCVMCSAFGSYVG